MIICSPQAPTKFPAFQELYPVLYDGNPPIVPVETPETHVHVIKQQPEQTRGATTSEQQIVDYHARGPYPASSRRTLLATR